jgi:ribonuclease HI
LRTVGVDSKQDNIRDKFLDSGSIPVTNNRLVPGNKVTNNQAEYFALVTGLVASDRLGIRRLEVKGDSNLVIEQMKGNFAVRSLSIMPLFDCAQQLSAEFSTIRYEAIPRAQNDKADSLARDAVELARYG